MKKIILTLTIAIFVGLSGCSSSDGPTKESVMNYINRAVPILASSDKVNKLALEDINSITEETSEEEMQKIKNGLTITKQNQQAILDDMKSMRVPHGIDNLNMDYRKIITNRIESYNRVINALSVQNVERVQKEYQSHLIVDEELINRALYEVNSVLLVHELSVESIYEIVEEPLEEVEESEEDGTQETEDTEAANGEETENE